MTLEEFIKALKNREPNESGEIVFNDEVFDNIDFSEIDEEDIPNSSIRFQDCKFNSQCILDIHFKGDLSFYRSDFTQDFHLSDCTVDGSLIFDKCNSSNIYINHCEVKGELSLDENTVTEDLDLSNSAFTDGISIIDSKVTGDLNLNSVEAEKCSFEYFEFGRLCNQNEIDIEYTTNENCNSSSFESESESECESDDDYSYNSDLASKENRRRAFVKPVKIKLESESESDDESDDDDDYLVSDSDSDSCFDSESKLESHLNFKGTQAKIENSPLAREENDSKDLINLRNALEDLENYGEKLKNKGQLGKEKSLAIERVVEKTKELICNSKTDSTININKYKNSISGDVNTLKKYRSCWPKVKKVLAAVTAVCSLGIAEAASRISTGKSLLFYTHETNSEKKLNHVNDALNKFDI
jgi:hypothetical protein